MTTAATSQDVPASAPADPWVLLHGTPLTPEVWAEVRPYLAGASVFCPNITPTEPGTAALVERVREHTAAISGRFRLVGHSFGGQVAIDIATAMPDRVSHITVLCSRDTPFPAFEATVTSLRAGTRPSPDATLARWFRPGELAENGRAVTYARSRLQQTDLESWAFALQTIAHYEHPTALSNLGIPVTLIACEFDAVSSPTTMKEMADRIPGATYRLLTGAAHMSPFLHPRALAGLLQG
jgi:3-oxoadipate enol-lactonase